MLIKNGGPNIRRDRVVLFPFDDYSIPFQHGLRLQLVGYEGGIGRRKIVIMPGDSGAPDSKLVVYYGTVRRVGGELWMWYLGQGFENIRDETLFWYAPWPEHDSDILPTRKGWGFQRQFW